MHLADDVHKVIELVNVDPHGVAHGLDGGRVCPRLLDLALLDLALFGL